MKAKLAAAVLLAGTALTGTMLATTTAAQTQGKVLRATMHADVRTLDPMWTTQVIASIHGNMIYDRLFASDEKLEPHPQMVEKWTVSADKKVYTFTLRDGLKFHDGTPVTTRDVIASMKRWGVRDVAGKSLFAFTDDLVATDAKTFEWRLKEPYGLVIDTLAKSTSSLPAVMREKEALTDPFQQVTEAIGSGPFVFKRDEWSPGSKAVYTKFRDYVPRSEPASGHAGGKVAKVDRVEFVWIADPQTQQSALVAGEIDFLEAPQVDFLPILEATPGVKLFGHQAGGSMGIIQLNHLHPPFNNVKARQAMLHIVKNPDFLNTFIPDRKLQKLCYSYFGCDTPMETDAGSEAYKAPPDYKRAEQLFKEAGYKGEPITILHATDHWYINPANLVLIQQMRKAGFLNLDVQAMDWGSVVSRRTKKEPPAQGGWNIFITGTSIVGSANPMTNVSISMGCEKAWFGWPCDEKFEEMRKAWGMAPDIEKRREIAVDLTKRAYEQVPFLSFAQWSNPSAYRSDRLSGMLVIPSLQPMWNIEKK